MMEIPLWHSGRAHTSLDHHSLMSYRGEPLATVMDASPMLVRRVVEKLRQSTADVVDLTQMWDAIMRAGELIDTAVLGGIGPAEHSKLVSLATGLPLHWSRASLSQLGERMRNIKNALAWEAPMGNAEAFRTGEVTLPGGRHFAWVPVGRVLGVVESSNMPTVQAVWVLALAMGWSVLLRPGSEDPLTPRRVLLALQEANFPADRIAMVSGGHDLVPAMLAACDRIFAYGGPAVGNVLGNDARVAFNGPGRSKVLVSDGEADGVADFLFDSITEGGGRKCVCTSGVIVQGDGGSRALRELAGRLDAMPLLDALDPDARVPVWKDPSRRPPAPARLATAHGVSFLKPELLVCESPTPPFGMELPSVWAAAVELRADESALLPLLRDSLVVTLLSPDPELRRRCLLEPSIHKVFSGPVPTWHQEHGAPHKGQLSDLCFIKKAAWQRGAS